MKRFYLSWIEPGACFIRCFNTENERKAFRHFIERSNIDIKEWSDERIDEYV